MAADPAPWWPWSYLPGGCRPCCAEGSGVTPWPSMTLRQANRFRGGWADVGLVQEPVDGLFLDMPRPNLGKARPMIQRFSARTHRSPTSRSPSCAPGPPRRLPQHGRPRRPRPLPVPHGHRAPAALTAGAPGRVPRRDPSPTLRACAAPSSGPREARSRRQASLSPCAVEDRVQAGHGQRLAVVVPSSTRGFLCGGAGTFRAG